MASNKNEQNDTAIDRLNDNLSSAGEKIANNKKVIFWVIGGIAVVAAFVLSYFFIYRNPHVNKAFEAYNNVEIVAQGNDSIAANEYKKVADNYSGNDAGKLAALAAGEAYYNEGKYKEALTYLKKFSSSEKVLDANAMILQGDCNVNLKKYDDALACYKKAISRASKNEQIVPRALLKCANIYDEQKKYDEALKCYEQIDSEFPNFQPGNVSIDAYIAREKARLGK